MTSGTASVEKHSTAEISQKPGYKTRALFGRSETLYTIQKKTVCALEIQIKSSVWRIFWEDLNVFKPEHRLLKIAIVKPTFAEGNLERSSCGLIYRILASPFMTQARAVRFTKYANTHPLRHFPAINFN